MLSDVHNGLRVLTRQAALKCEITADRMAHASQFIDLVASSRLRVQVDERTTLAVARAETAAGGVEGLTSGARVRLAWRPEHAVPLQD